MTQVEYFGVRQLGWLIRGVSAVLSCSKESPRVAAYLRSAVENEEHIASQLAEIRQYLENRDWELACAYLDNGYSGNSSQRPGLLRLQQDIQGGCVDLVVVCDLARLFRNLSGLRRFM